MNSLTPFQARAVLALRLATGANFLSAVGGRFGLWGHGSWSGFVNYTAQVNAFAPRAAAPALAVAATAVETVLAVLLLTGWQTRRAALGAAGLTAVFALAMSVSFGPKEALDYSVWVDATSALLLTAMPAYPGSLDAWLARRRRN